jgi:hypothetical protein
MIVFWSVVAVLVSIILACIAVGMIMKTNNTGLELLMCGLMGVSCIVLTAALILILCRTPSGQQVLIGGALNESAPVVTRVPNAAVVKWVDDTITFPEPTQIGVQWYICEEEELSDVGVLVSGTHTAKPGTTEHWVYQSYPDGQSSIKKKIVK